MKKYCIVLLFLGFSVFSQKKYSFDYLIQYENKDSLDAEKKTLYLLTNSKDNSYILNITEVDKDVLRLVLRDVDGFWSVSFLSKMDFVKSTSIEVPCEALRFSEEHIDLKRYVYKVNSDTLIGDKQYKNYSMRYRNSREAKKFKTGKSFYVIEEGTDFHKPLALFSRAFDLFYVNNEMPNGIAKEIYNISKFGKKFTYTLIDFKKFDMLLSFPEGCKAKRI